MIDSNALLTILRQEIEEHYAIVAIGAKVAVDWNEEHLTKLQKMMDTALRRLRNAGRKKGATKTPVKKVVQKKHEVSISVLKNIFKYHTYTINELKKDRRREKILTKLAIFAGYENWDDFIHEKVSADKKHTQNPEVILEVVRKAAQAEFDAYKSLPSMKRDDLTKYFVKDGAAYNVINEILIKEKEKGWVLTNKDNPSLFEIYEMRIEKITSKEAIVISNQYWFLRWWDTKKSRYAWFYNHKGDREEKLILTKDGWKILSSFYSATRDGGTFGKEPNEQITPFS